MRLGPIIPLFGGTVTSAYVTQTSSSSNATAYTFSSTSIGTAAGDRIVVVSVSGSASDESGNAMASLTVGGIAATKAAEAWHNGKLTAIWYAAVPTGTTATIVATFGDSQTRCSIAVHTLTGASASPSDTATTSGSGSSLSLSALTIPTDGVAIVSFANGSSSIVTWTNATEDYDVAVESSDRHSGARRTTAGAPTITADGGSASQALVGASWGPS